MECVGRAGRGVRREQGGRCEGRGLLGRGEFVVGGCWRLLLAVVVGGCWRLLAVVVGGCCWRLLLAVVVGGCPLSVVRCRLSVVGCPLSVVGRCCRCRRWWLLLSLLSLLAVFVVAREFCCLLCDYSY